MPKFLTGFTVGVFTGWLFHDVISQNLRKAVDYGNEKMDDIEAERDNEGSVTASLRWPANGTNLSPERKSEINNSTPDSPVTITWDEIGEMNLSHVKVHVGSGRFKIDEVKL